MKKFIIGFCVILFAFTAFSELSLAGKRGYYKPRHYHNEYNYRHDRWYKSPYFWGPVAGAVIGGALAAPRVYADPYVRPYRPYRPVGCYVKYVRYYDPYTNTYVRKKTRVCR